MRFLLAAILACGQAAMAVAGTPTDPIMRPPVEHLSPALVDFHAKLSRDFHPKLSHPVVG